MNTLQERKDQPSNDHLPRWLKPASGLIVRMQKLGLAIGTMHVLGVPGRMTVDDLVCKYPLGA